MAAEFGNRSWGIAFLVAFGVVMEVIAAACSSPQTAEINADKRAETLMKWVYIGLAMSAGAIIISATMDKQNSTPIILGGSLAGGTMWGLYIHAKQAGLRSCQDGTES